jgi:hypothetical protein
MPQLVAVPVPGSAADALPRNQWGEVDGTNAFVSYIEDRKKHQITLEEVPVAQLKATQNELVGSKVANIWLALQDPHSATYKRLTEEPLFVSKDNYVLDGHHRWAATVARAISNATLPITTMKVKKVNENIEQLVQDANQFAQEFGLQQAHGIVAR